MVYDIVIMITYISILSMVPYIGLNMYKLEYIFVFNMIINNLYYIMISISCYLASFSGI